MNRLRVDGYLIPKKGKYSEDFDKINEILEKADLVCIRDASVPGESVEVVFSGWKSGFEVFSDAIFETKDLVQTGEIEIIDEEHDSYICFEMSDGKVTVPARTLNEWRSVSPLAPDELEYVKGLLMERMERGDHMACRLYSRIGE